MLRKIVFFSTVLFVSCLEKEEQSLEKNYSNIKEDITFDTNSILDNAKVSELEIKSTFSHQVDKIEKESSSQNFLKSSVFLIFVHRSFLDYLNK